MSRLDLPAGSIAQLALAGVAVAMLVRPKLFAERPPLPMPRLPISKLPMPRRPARPVALHSLRFADVMRTPKLGAKVARLVKRNVPLPRMAPPALPHTAGRHLNASAAILATSVLADSTVEHYRGSFENRAMYTPLLVAALTLGASLFGTTDPRAKNHRGRDAIYATAAAVGAAGLAFHVYNITKRPGGVSWQNLFYAAPIGAPAALTLAGLLGRGAERVRETPLRKRPTVLGLPAGRALAAVAATGLAGTVGEAGLLHFRGAFQNPAMFIPVTLPPVAAVFLGISAVRPNRFITRAARWWLRLTALLGFAGVGFHAYGISRAMGGWRNWSQNVIDGPPLPAPPSFTGLSLAGLAALSLIEGESHE
ncbi:MAG: hypothetical protein KGK33_08490 [Hyphomicrobiales bacterium]|nr:hypothetical protein [Hyphomicrobiales bacterium]